MVFLQYSRKLSYTLEKDLDVTRFKTLLCQIDLSYLVTE